MSHAQARQRKWCAALLLEAGPAARHPALLASAAGMHACVYGPPRTAPYLCQSHARLHHCLHRVGAGGRQGTAHTSLSLPGKGRVPFPPPQAGWLAIQSHSVGASPLGASTPPRLDRHDTQAVLYCTACTGPQVPTHEMCRWGAKSHIISWQPRTRFVLPGLPPRDRRLSCVVHALAVLAAACCRCPRPPPPHPHTHLALLLVRRGHQAKGGCQHGLAHGVALWGGQGHSLRGGRGGGGTRGKSSSRGEHTNACMDARRVERREEDRQARPGQAAGGRLVRACMHAWGHGGMG